MKKNDFCEKPNELQTRAAETQLGFSVIELIVAMVIFMIVTASIFGLLRISRFDRNRSSNRADIMKNTRSAINIIGRDALNAGLGYHRTGALVPNDFLATRLGVKPDITTNRDILTAVVAGDNINLNNIQENPNAKTDIVAFAYRDLDFNPDPVDPVLTGRSMSLSGVTSTSSGATARVQTATGETTAAANNYDLYLIQSETTQVAVMANTKVSGSTTQIDFATGDPLGINQALNASGSSRSLLRRCTPPTIISNCTTYSGTEEKERATIKRIFWVSYKVKPDGTLVRTLFGNNTGQAASQQIQELPIAYNVKNLKFRYVLKDGTVSNNPSAGPDKIAGNADDVANNLNLIRQMTVTLEVASTELDEQTGTPIIITLNATFSLRNLEYDAG